MKKVCSVLTFLALLSRLSSWSAPNASVHGRMPPDPRDMSANDVNSSGSCHGTTTQSTYRAAHSGVLWYTGRIAVSHSRHIP